MLANQESFKVLAPAPAAAPSLPRSLGRSQEIYAFTFGFSLEPGHKNLPREAAVALWQLLLPPHFPLLGDWCRFMEERGPKMVTRDTWTLLLQFARQVKVDLSNYDEDGAWLRSSAARMVHAAHSRILSPPLPSAFAQVRGR